MFYATLLLLEASRSGLIIDTDKTTPDFRDFHQDLVSGKVEMTTAEAKTQYGMIHLREALRNMRTQRFEVAVARI